MVLILTACDELERAEERQLGVVELERLHGEADDVEGGDEVLEPREELHDLFLFRRAVVEVAVAVGVDVILGGQHRHHDRVHALLHARNLVVDAELLEAYSQQQ